MSSIRGKKRSPSPKNGTAEITASDWLRYCTLVLLVFAIYSKVATYGFVDFDDDTMVALNPHIAGGLTWSSVSWAFTETNLFYWQPLVWLSFMFGVQLFGPSPEAHHIINVAIHAANGVLLCFVLEMWTRARWRSFFVAALFAVHPLRVESVAWITERKDVLSAFFFLLVLFAYGRYTRTPSPGRYLLVLVAFVAGLMSKPMLVTVPLLLLLLDHWPLKRPESFKAMLVEKIAFLALAVLSIWVTLSGLSTNGTSVALPWTVKASTALLAYAKYLWLLVWPSHLAVLYAYNPHIPRWQLITSTCVLVTVSALALQTRKRHPYVLFGWMWYLLSLAPAVGLVQSGSQALADRFTYLPCLGLLIALVWGIGAAVQDKSRWRRVAWITGLGIVATLSIASRLQVSVWQNSVTLFGRAAAVSPQSAVVHHNFGFGLAQQSDFYAAIREYQLAIRIDPYLEKVHYNLGRALSATAQPEKAVVEFDSELALHPKALHEHDIRIARGVALMQLGRTAEAKADFQHVLSLQPQSPEAHGNWGAFLASTGDLQGAIKEFRTAVDLNPAYLDARLNFAHSLAAQGKRNEALEQYQLVLRQSPFNADAVQQLSQLLKR